MTEGEELFQRYRRIVLARDPNNRRRRWRPVVAWILFTLLFSFGLLALALHFSAEAHLPSWIVPTFILAGAISVPIAGWIDLRRWKKWIGAIGFLAFQMLSGAVIWWLQPAHPDSGIVYLALILSVGAGGVTTLMVLAADLKRLA